jgi:signal transduction histidine kinase
MLQVRTLDGEAVQSEKDLPSSSAISEGKAVGPFEYIVTAPDGEVRRVVATATPVSVDHELFGTVIVGNDVTEQRRVSEELRQAQKMEAIGRLAGGVAHDFNNLLTAITGYSDMLLRRTDLSAEARNHIEQIRRAADRAASLTRQLLVFSRKQIMQTRVMNLNETIGELEGILRRLIGEDVKLETRYAPNLDSVQADPNQMEQVIINLAVNARDAMPEGGRLVIETRNADVQGEAAERNHEIEPNRYCLLLVSDTGHGMSDEIRSRIFEPFFTTKEIGKGTGLGLSTVYGIVKQSGGHILVESEPGRGTTFKVYLPCVKGKPEADAKQQQPDRIERARGTETILLVEDEEMVRSLAREVLRLYGYTVIEAQDGRRALEVCRDNAQRIDLMLTDVAMPEMNGVQLARAALILRPAMRVLYMSGYTEAAIVQHGVLDGNVPFIRKPWTPAAFLAKVRGVLEEK